MTQSQIIMSQSLTESMIQEIKEANSSTEATQKPETTNDSSDAATDKGGSGDAQSQYEVSVTEKENLLISSFNKNLNLNGSSSNSDHVQEQTTLVQVQDQEIGDGVHHNGKNGSEAVDIGIKTTELIIQDAINQQNGHKNGGFDDVL